MAKAQSQRFARGCAATMFLGAFLLFQVQPVISKMILPWFGGSPAVWTTCLLFFQVLLLGGYAYAHALARLRRPLWHLAVHVPLLAAALLTLPITRAEWFKPADSSHPTGKILLLLAASVGLPYFLLSSTGPLVQAWFARIYRQRSPYRLYALSNIGSLGALLTYPVLVEPALTTRTQGIVWSAGFVLFALFSGWLAIALWRQGKEARGPAESAGRSHAAASGQRSEPTAAARGFWPGRLAIWILLPAFASMMLLAVTNHLCQNVAVVPFLWIAPLSLYLLSFIICFDKDAWYVRRWFALGAAAAVLLVSDLLLVQNLDDVYPSVQIHLPLEVWADNVLVQIVFYLLVLLLVCMVCHGEVVRSKPPAERLTAFYLSIAAGGALGGLFVALVCPYVFSSYLEMNLGLIASFVLACAVLARGGWEKWFAGRALLQAVGGLAAVVGLLVVVWAQVLSIDTYLLETDRNFYGVLTVKEHFAGRDAEGKEDPLHGYALYNGDTMHGYQFISPGRRRRPTTYFVEASGVGVTLRRFPRQGSLRVGVIGLGVGTVAAYGRPGDCFRFYEINPKVREFADRYFTFLQDSAAKIELVLGDGRLSLEREAPQRFDVFILDAFTGDTIPTHLLTKEAFALYQRHLRDPDQGVIAVHVSNRYLDLIPVVARAGEHFKLTAVWVSNTKVKPFPESPSDWVLLTRNRRFLGDPLVRQTGVVLTNQPATVRLWTDQYSNLFQLLRKGPRQPAEPEGWFP